MYVYCLYSDHIQTKTILQLGMYKQTQSSIHTHKNCLFKNPSEDWWDGVCKEEVMEVWCSDSQWKERTDFQKLCFEVCTHTQTHTQKNFKEHGPARYSDAHLLIPALREWRQKDQEFMDKFSVGQMRPSLKKPHRKWLKSRVVTHICNSTN